MAVSVIHTADVHLSAQPNGRAARDVYDAFACIIEKARAEKTDFLLIAGDLFDSPVLHGFAVDFVRRAFLRLVNTRVIYICGNHDNYGADCPLTGMEQVFVLGKEPLVFEEEGVRFWAQMPAYNVKNSPYIEIGLWHGDLDFGQYNPITKESISLTGLDYLAMGHIHKGELPHLIGQTYAAYCGTPQGRGFDETGDKGVLCGTVDKGNVRLSFSSVSVCEYRELVIDVTNLSGSEVLSAVIERTDDKNCYKIRLVGTPTERWDSAAFMPFLQGKDVRFVNETALPSNIWAQENEMSLTGFFLRGMRERMDKAAGTQKPLLEKALLLGLSAQEEDVCFQPKEDEDAD